MGEIVSLEALAGHVRDGMTVAVPTDRAGVAMAATAAIVSRAPKDLHLVCVPVSGMQADMLIGAGLIGTLETSAITLGEAGGAPRFADRLKAGAFRMLDATCPAVLAGLRAGQMGIPFMAIRGIIGSDILNVRPDWKVIDNPFEQGDRIVVVPAIKPDVALFHAPEADRFGNVRIGRQTELAAMAYAAKTALVTVERIVETSLLADEATSGGVLPALYVGAIAEVKHGAWPLALAGEYVTDDAEVARYAKMARSADGFAAYMKGFAQAFEAVA